MADRLAMAWPGLQVERVAETGSTNSDLLERARTAGDASAVGFPPTLLIAERQRAGRGRRGRAWQSSAGRSLTCSLALPLAASDWSGLSLAVGVAIADALEGPGAARRRIGLKWPNDLWLVDLDGSGRKLGGVLIESLPRTDARIAVIGIGINVQPQAVDDASTGFACWQEIEPDATPACALERLIAPLRHALARFERDGFGAFVDRFAARDLLRGRAVRTSAPELEGVALDVTARGALRLRTAEGVREIESGEVSVRPVARGGRTATAGLEAGGKPC